MMKHLACELGPECMAKVLVSNLWAPVSRTIKAKHPISYCVDGYVYARLCNEKKKYPYVYRPEKMSKSGELH